MQTQEEVNQQMIDELEQVRKANRTIVNRVAWLCIGLLVICIVVASVISMKRNAGKNLHIIDEQIVNENCLSSADEEITISVDLQ